MTVAELMEKLRDMPQDMEIVAQDRDYECRDLRDPWVEQNGVHKVNGQWVPYHVVWV